MLIELLKDQPMLFVAWMLAIVYGITVHEFAHAWIAYKQGDATAKLLGRVTLNPLAHLDLLGVLMLLFAGFGWGKPVPVNHYNLRNGKTSDNLVSLAGIFTNLLSVGVFLILFKIFFPGFDPILTFLGAYPQINLLAFFFATLIVINLVLAVFNLIPIPPLDGSHVLFNILPEKYTNFKILLAKNGPIILIGLILLDNFSNLNIFSRFYWFLLDLIRLAF